jgi:hypothetical protein
MEGVEDMNVWAVVHATRRGAPPRHIARLFITDVPGDVTARDLTRALTRAGRQFGEFGIPWANHYVAPRAAWRDEVEGAWRRGDVACIAYADLDDAARIAVTLRLPRDLHARLQRVAQQRGVPAHTVIIEAVDGYVAVQEHMLGRREDENGEQR